MTQLFIHEHAQERANDRAAEQALNARFVGMATFMAAWTMLFVALCLAVLALRDPAFGPVLAKALGPGRLAVATTAVIMSSLAMVFRFRWLAIALVSVFLVVQVLLLLAAFDVEALRPRSIALLLTMFHAAHGLVVAVALARSMLTKTPFGAWGIFWHTLMVAWLVICGVLFW